MYKAIHVLVFLLLCNLCHAQAPNFFVDGARWVYSTHESSEPGQKTIRTINEQNIIHGDTILHELNYKKLYTTRHTIVEITNTMPPYPSHYDYYDSIGPTFLRYDTLLKQVFYLPGIDSAERMIYDFNLLVGDSTIMQVEDSGFPGTTFIDSVDTIQLFGIPTKRFFLYFFESNPYNYILEGVGGSNGLTFFQPQIPTLGGGIYLTHLVCFQYQDSVFAPLDGECPFIDFISATHPVKDDYSITVSPNPTPGTFTLITSESIPGAICTIVDCLGRVVQSFELHETTISAHLDIPGLYFWQVAHRGSVVQSGKVICNPG